MVPCTRGAADAVVPYRDRALVAAAATSNPLVRACRILVVFLSDGFGRKGGPTSVIDTNSSLAGIREVVAGAVTRSCEHAATRRL
ncbi:hypothetical protein GCM10010378_01360 [Streptomyces viridochromogenes]